MKRIASLLMLAARSTLWKAAGITLASCLAEAGLFLAALSGWQDTVRTAYYEYSNPMGLEGLLMQYPLSWCFRIGLVLVCPGSMKWMDSPALSPAAVLWQPDRAAARRRTARIGNVRCFIKAPSK